MEPRDEHAEGWTLGSGERVSACLNPFIAGVKGAEPASAECTRCAQDPFRIIVIESAEGVSRKLAACRRHFVQVCKDCDIRNGCMSYARLHVLGTSDERS